MGGMDIEFLEYLKNLGIEFVKFNDMGHSPLGKAAFKGHKHHCEWIMENIENPDIHVPDKNGYTPAMQAANNGFHELAKFLEELAISVPKIEDENAQILKENRKESVQILYEQIETLKIEETK